MPRFAACALVALVLIASTAHAARNNRILLILPEAGDWRDEVLAFWNDGIGLEVDVVADPALGAAPGGPEEGMLAAFDADAPGAEWVILRVNESSDIGARLDALGETDGYIAAMGPYEAFRDNPAAAYRRLDAVIVTTPALPDDGERAVFLAQLRIVATQANDAKPGILMGTSLAPAQGEENPLLAGQKLFADTRNFIGIFAVDTTGRDAGSIALAEAVATAPAPRSGGMYMDMMQRPGNVLDPTKEVWMQRGVMVLGVLTILGVFLIVRYKRPPDATPPKAG